MTVDDLIYVGLNGYVLAVHRESGAIVWSNNQLKRGYVTLLLDRLIVSANGYLYCLDPSTGEIMWHNPTKGYGTGVASLISGRGQSSQTVVSQAAAADAAASSSAAAASTAVVT